MGGNALKTVKTERKNIEEYNHIKTLIISQLNKYINSQVVFEPPEKYSFGDLDILYIDDGKIAIEHLIKELFDPKEIVNNGLVTSFDYDNFQIDLIKSVSIADFNSKMFYYSYGDVGPLIGKITNFYNIKFGDWIMD
jgi:hypothetical protein